MSGNHGRKVHTSSRGVAIDMEALSAANSQAVAVTGRGSELRMNARGDVLGPNGQVVKRREQIDQEYNATPTGNVKTVGLNTIAADTFETPTQAIERLTGESAAPAAPAEPKGTAKVDAPTNVVDRNRARKLIDKSE